MESFRKPKGYQLRPAWHYATRGMIWKLYPDDSGNLIGEERELDRKVTAFFCLERQTGTVRWEHLRLDEQWWIGIQTAHRGVLFLHGYAAPDMPGHKGIFAIDLQSGQLVWHNREWRFRSIAGDALCAFQQTPEGEKMIFIDYRTGTIRNDSRKDDFPGGVPEESSTAGETGSIVFPVPLQENSGNHPAIEALIRGVCETSSVPGEIEFAECGDLIVIHHGARKGNGDGAIVDNLLKVVDRKSGNLLFADSVASNSPAFTREAFFVEGNMLYFVRDRTTLYAVSLAR